MPQDLLTQDSLRFQAAKVLIRGHEDLWTTLQGMWHKKTLPYVLALRGPCGLGQDLLVCALACFILEQNLEFPLWERLESGLHPNVLHITPKTPFQEAQEILEKIAHNHTRMILMTQMHLFNRSVANLFLKVLEDPPPHRFFLLTGQTPLKTVASRALWWTLSPFDEKCWNELTQEMPLPKDPLFFRLCQGGMGLALKILPLFDRLKQGWHLLTHDRYSPAWATSMAQDLWAYRLLLEVWLHHKILQVHNHQGAWFFLRTELLACVDHALVYHQDPLLTIESIYAKLCLFSYKKDQ